MLIVDITPEGSRYEATRPGYGLPTHEHETHAQCHSVECIEGRIMVFFADRAVVLDAGQTMPPVDVAERHGIATLSERAVWFNRPTQPMPISADEADNHLQLESRCDVPRRYLVPRP